MKRYFPAVISSILGMVLGGAAVQTIHAQSKGPAFTVAEIDVTDPEGYAKEYAPKARPILEKNGAHYLALAGAASSSGKVMSIDGDAPKRVGIHRWDNAEKAMAAFNSPEYRDLRKVGQKYAKFKIYVVDGLPQ